jgi:hypothetical protein
VILVLFSANFVGKLLQFRDGESAAIRGTHYRAYTGACNHANWNALFFEDFENPQCALYREQSLP